jgi:prevent-host-death family protein
MPQIRPVSDLRNNFAEISKIVHESNEPVFLTRNGYGDMVVMSIEKYEAIELANEIFTKLNEAELEVRTTNDRYSHAEVFAKVREQGRI